MYFDVSGKDIGISRYDRTIDGLVTFGSNPTKQGIIDLINASPANFEPGLPTNVTNAILKTLGDLNSQAPAKDPKTLVLTITEPNTVLSSCASLREKLKDSSVDLVVLLMNATVDKYKEVNITNRTGFIHCLYESEELEARSVFTFDSFSELYDSSVINAVVDRVCQGVTNPPSAAPSSPPSSFVFPFIFPSICVTLGVFVFFSLFVCSGADCYTQSGACFFSFCKSYGVSFGVTERIPF